MARPGFDSPVGAKNQSNNHAMEVTIEKQVADTVLQRATDVLTLDGVDYPLAPPTLATLIMVSELTATLPKMNVDEDNLLQEVMRNARHCRTIGKITAVLLLGAKRVLECIQVPCEREKRSYFPKFLRRIVRKRTNGETVAEVDKLAEIVLNELSPATLQGVLMRRLIDMQIADFFALTTSLTTVNHTKRTREVEEATASGE